jgi:hypothetical protein
VVHNLVEHRNYYNLMVLMAHHLERRVVIGAKVRKTWLPVATIEFLPTVSAPIIYIYAVSILVSL